MHHEKILTIVAALGSSSKFVLTFTDCVQSSPGILWQKKSVKEQFGDFSPDQFPFRNVVALWHDSRETISNLCRDLCFQVILVFSAEHCTVKKYHLFAMHWISFGELSPMKSIYALLYIERVPTNWSKEWKTKLLSDRKTAISFPPIGLLVHFSPPTRKTNALSSGINRSALSQNTLSCTMQTALLTLYSL